MKKVSLRNFQLKPSKYLDSLPVILTRYKKGIATIQPIDCDGTTHDGARFPSKGITVVEEDIDKELEKAKEEAFKR